MMYIQLGESMNGQLVPQFDGISDHIVIMETILINFTELVLLSVTLFILTGDEDGNTRYSITSLDNDDISPNSTLDRTSLGLNTNQNLEKIFH